MANESYAKSSSGILKGLEFVTLLLAWVFFYEFTGEAEPEHYEDWYAFFFFTHLIGWIGTVLVFVLFVFGLHDKAGTAKCWYTVALVFHFVLGVCCIVGAGYWAKWANDNDGAFKFFFEKRWNYLVAAVASSVVSFLLLIGDAFKSLKQVQNTW